MNDQTKIWILGSIVTVIGSVLVFLAIWFFNRVVRILTDIQKQLEAGSIKMTVQDLKIENHDKDIVAINNRLDRNSNRVADMDKVVSSLRDKIK